MLEIRIKNVRNPMSMAPYVSYKITFHQGGYWVQTEDSLGGIIDTREIMVTVSNPAIILAGELTSDKRTV